MAINSTTIERIMSAANIVDVVSRYVTLRRSGASFKGLCPFHDDTTPSFYVNPARGVCKCFSCGEGGNVVHFVMKMEQLNYPEALRYLGKMYGIEVEDRQLTPEEKARQSQRESMFAVNEWASNYFMRNMLDTEDGRAVGLAYFRSRGFRDDIIEKFRLGFAPDTWDSLATEAKVKGYQEEFLIGTGLCYKRDNGKLNDRYRGRVIFPWFALNGKVVAFGGRVLDARTKGVNQKYINSPESEIFHKSNELYGIFQAKKQISKEDCVYMVEGYTDVISMHQCGIENVVANSGTALNDAQIRLLHRLTSNIVLIYDGDAAGIHAALRGTDMLLAQGMNVKVLLLPDGDDPDSFARKHNATEFREYIDSHKTDFIVFKANLLSNEAGHDPRRRSELANDILNSICVIPDEIVRASYVHECSEVMRMDEQMLLRKCKQLRRDYLERRERERNRPAPRYQQSDAPQQSDPQLQQTAPPPDNQQFPPQSSGDVAPLDGLVPPPPDEGDFPPPPQLEDIPADTSAHMEQTIGRSPAEQRIAGLERLVMQTVVRYGEQMVVADADSEQTMSLVQYVHEELSADGLAFSSPIYVDMLEQAVGHATEEGFSCSRFFSASPQFEISRVASDLLTDPYATVVPEFPSASDKSSPENINGFPSYNTQQLSDRISHLLLDYKFCIVQNALDASCRLLADPTVLSDSKRFVEVMQENMRLSALQRELSKYLGDRVIRK